MIKKKKKISGKTFKQCGLAITIECNLKTVNILGITFDLQNNVYKPYYKAYITDINTNSNHPAGILKQLTNLLKKDFQKYHQARTYLTIP